MVSAKEDDILFYHRSTPNSTSDPSEDTIEVLTKGVVNYRTSQDDNDPDDYTDDHLNNFYDPSSYDDNAS